MVGCDLVVGRFGKYFALSLRTGVKFSTRQEGVKKDKNKSTKDDVHGSILREERNGRLGICCVCYHRGIHR